jgi:3-dehydroquinate synthase
VVDNLATIALTIDGSEKPIFVGRGALGLADELLPNLPSRVFVVSSPTVWNLHGSRLLSGLKRIEAVPVLIDDREETKTLSTAGKIMDAILLDKARRDDAVVAFGGGVVSDVGGFAAAILLRGLRWYAVPTTLLAMVDAAIGGKTGVDHACGKNLIGAFHFPEAVLADPELLATLPDRQLRSGLVEALKTLWIGDAASAQTASGRIEQMAGRDPDDLDVLIKSAARVKAEIVGRDPREEGLRRVLNLGHTLGHAFEAAGGYRDLTHGEAVAWGLAAALDLSVARAGLPEAEARGMREALRRLGPFPRPVRDPEALLAFLRRDKKARRDGISGILLERVGRARIERISEEDWIAAASRAVL